jgi:hypothetical protein
MNAPPAICRFCGWKGPAPGFHIENSTDVTFEGSPTTCPRCGRQASIVSGTYDFVGGVVRMVRDANLTLADVNALRRAAAQARETGQAPEEFVAANPAAAPIVNLIVQQRPGRDWLIVFLMVVTVVISYLQNAKYHAEDQQQQRSAATPTTLVLTEGQVSKIAREVGTKLRTESLLRTSPKPATASRRKKGARKSGGASAQRRKNKHGRGQR